MELLEILRAHERLRGVARHTPLLESRTWSADAGAPVYLKAENLQRTGSFKIRGATNFVAQLSANERERGVIAASAGNHAQGVAVAAAAAGIPALVVMPASAAFAKVEATRGYGAEVVQAGADFQGAVEAMERIAAERDLTMVPAFDDERIIAGQGTLGLEICAALPDVELVLVPVGGGGLAAGVASAIKAVRPSTSVIGVQASASPNAAHALRGEAAEETRHTIADGIAVPKPGTLTMPLLRRLLDDIVCVDDEAITAAMVRLLEFSKLVVEGAGAVGAAALLSGAVQTRGRKTVVVLSGGNVDVNLLARIVEHGLGESGRYATIIVALPDRPGQLAQVVEVLAAAGANVLEVQHRRTGSRLSFGMAEVELLVETRNAAHTERVFAALRAAGYREEAAPARRGYRFVAADE
jgi:threonine dehydratase